MAHFMICNDLHNRRNYQPLYDALANWERFASNSSAINVRDALNKLVDGDDSIAVIELKPGSGWGSVRAKPAGVEWLKRNIQA